MEHKTDKTMELKNEAEERLDYDLRGEEHLDKKKLVIICHGLADTKDAPFLVTLAEKIVTQGLSCLNFSFSGNGKSEGRFEDATYHKEVEDLKAVIDTCKNELGVERFCLVGHSMAGGVIRVVAAQEPAVKALVVLAGVADATSFKDKFPKILADIEQKGTGYFLEEKFGARYPITKKYLESTKSIDIMASAPKILCSVLCVLGSGDATIRRKQEQEWLSLLPQNAKSWLVVLPGLDHGFNRNSGEAAAKKGAEYLESIVVPWLIEHFV